MKRHGHLLFAGLLIAFAGCASAENVTPQALARARKIWEKAGIRDYDFDWETSGARNEQYKVAVRDGQVRSVLRVLPDGREVPAHPGDPSAYSVDGLFRIINEELDQLQREKPFGQPKGAQFVLQFSADPKLGYPRSYRRDVEGSARGIAIDVTRFQPVPHGKPAPASPAAGQSGKVGTR